MHQQRNLLANLPQHPKGMHVSLHEAKAVEGQLVRFGKLLHERLRGPQVASWHSGEQVVFNLELHGVIDA